MNFYVRSFMARIEREKEKKEEKGANYHLSLKLERQVCVRTVCCYFESRQTSLYYKTFSFFLLYFRVIRKLFIYLPYVRFTRCMTKQEKYLHNKYLALRSVIIMYSKFHVDYLRLRVRFTEIIKSGRL